MTEENNEEVLQAMLEAMKPVAQIMLTAGISHREMTEILKRALVEVATNEYGLRGRPTNISRVAVMTGITRKEIRRVRDNLASGNTRLSAPASPVRKILDGWRTAAEFQDKNGRPAKLKFLGENKSFSKLVHGFGGGVPPGAMRTALKRIGCIRVDKNGDIHYKGDNVLSAERASGIASQLSEVVAPALQSIANDASSWRGGPEKRPYKTSLTVVVNKRDAGRLETVWAESIDEVMASFSKIMETYELLHGDQKGEGESREVTAGSYIVGRDV